MAIINAGDSCCCHDDDWPPRRATSKTLSKTIGRLIRLDCITTKTTRPRGIMTCCCFHPSALDALLEAGCVVEASRRTAVGTGGRHPGERRVFVGAPQVINWTVGAPKRHSPGSSRAASIDNNAGATGASPDAAERRRTTLDGFSSDLPQQLPDRRSAALGRSGRRAMMIAAANDNGRGASPSSSRRRRRRGEGNRRPARAHYATSTSTPRRRASVRANRVRRPSRFKMSIRQRRRAGSDGRRQQPLSVAFRLSRCAAARCAREPKAPPPPRQ